MPAFQGFDQAKGVIITWFSVITRGPHAFEQIDLEQPATLFYALRFTLYMALASFLVTIPASARFDFKNFNLIKPFWIVESYVEYLSFGLILYGCMKLFGGTASLEACIAAYCLLTAYLPIISVLMLPIHAFLLPSMASTQQGPELEEMLRDRLFALSPWELSGFILSFLLTTVAFVVFYSSVFRTFRMLNKLSSARSVAAFILAFACFFVFTFFFLEPWISRLLNA